MQTGVYKKYSFIIKSSYRVEGVISEWECEPLDWIRKEELAYDTVTNQLGEGRSMVGVNWPDKAVRKIGQKLHLHNAFIYQSMPMLFNLLKSLQRLKIC